MDVEADPVRVQKRTVSHFKGLEYTFKMRYSTSLNSHWIQRYRPSKLNILEKNLRFTSKTNVFLNVQLWRPVSLDPVRVQRRAVSHFKGLFKTFKMRYSTFLYSYWIGLHVHFKNAILHLKRAIGPLLLSLCVHKPWQSPNLNTGRSKFLVSHFGLYSPNHIS